MLQTFVKYHQFLFDTRKPQKILLNIWCRHGQDCKHGHYRSQKLLYWVLKLRYRYLEPLYQFFKNVTIRGQECQGKVNTIRYLFVISWNCIVTCFSSWFVLNFCTQNNIKLIIFYSKWYKTNFFKIKQAQNRDYIM